MISHERTGKGLRGGVEGGDCVDEEGRKWGVVTEEGGDKGVHLY